MYFHVKNASSLNFAFGEAEYIRFVGTVHPVSTWHLYSMVANQGKSGEEVVFLCCA